MIIIPAFEPKRKLINLILDLNQILDHNAFECQIVVINDGSSTKEAKEIFCEIIRHGIILLEHRTNCGKGAAIKTGINYAQANKKKWVVTADADGQHLPHDIFNVMEKGVEWGSNYVIGVRDFDKDTPLRSRFGNYITTSMFNFFHGGKIKDTQTGLRYIPQFYFEKLNNIHSNRYEFELAALILAVKEKNVRQIHINTVYEPGNPTSHFRKFIDSARIYWIFARSIVTSISSAIVDIFVFMVLQKFLSSTFVSILVSRSIATIMYFSLARNFVFKTRKEVFRQLILYTSLVFINALVLSPVINYLYTHFVLSKEITYVLLAAAFYGINLFIQKKFIFRDV